MHTSPLRVLIGDVAHEDARLRSILHGDELHFVRTTGEMERALDARPFDLGVICVQFDESRMFETLRILGERGGRMPVACIRGDSASRGQFSLERYREPVASLGAEALIDFTAVPDGSAGNDHIRRQLYACVGKADRMSRSNVYTRTLEAAAHACGGRPQLAATLGVPLQDLLLWMGGEEMPPYAMFMAALDLVGKR